MEGHVGATRLSPNPADLQCFSSQSGLGGGEDLAESTWPHSFGRSCVVRLPRLVGRPDRPVDTDRTYSHILDKVRAARSERPECRESERGR